MSLTMHDAARQYWTMGLHPIPCAPRSKRALVKWERYQREQPRLEEIDAWWAATPDANVALVLGRGSFAVDLDGGPDAEAMLRGRGVTLPAAAPRNRTAHGFHVLLSTDRPVSDAVGLLRGIPRPGQPKPAQVDIRGVGIIVVPPSIHPTGVPYAWDVPLTLPLPPSPPELLALLTQRAALPAAVSGGLSWVLDALQGVGEGLRNETCTKLAGLLLGKGLDAETVTAWMLLWASQCAPPMAAAEVRGVVRSIAAREGASAEEPNRTVVALSLSATLDEWLRQTDPQTVGTPFTPLSHYLGGGWRPGDLVYLGARPGVGKTAFALECARTAAEAGHGVLVISREMIRTALARRIVAQASRVPAAALRSGRMDLVEQTRLHSTLRQLRGLPLWLCDAAVSLREMVTLITGWADQPLGLVVIDYLQLVRGPEAVRERRFAIEAVSQGLKTLAIQAKLPILCLSSLSRASGEKGADDPRPTLDRLRESGELEHDADIVLFLHRKFGATETECIVAKNRDGRTGVAHLRFLPEFVAFEEMEAVL